MLYTLKGELIKRGLVPVRAVMDTLGCSESSARNKLCGKTDFTISEATKIIRAYFSAGTVDACQLFEDTKDSA